MPGAFGLQWLPWPGSDQKSEVFEQGNDANDDHDNAYDLLRASVKWQHVDEVIKLAFNGQILNVIQDSEASFRQCSVAIAGVGLSTRQTAAYADPLAMDATATESLVKIDACATTVLHKQRIALISSPPKRAERACRS